MKSVHVPEHIVLKLTIEDRDQLLFVLSRAYTTEFTKKMEQALFEGLDLTLEANRNLPW